MDGTGCRLVFKGEGLGGNEDPVLSSSGDGDSATGVSMHRRAKFCSVSVAASPFSNAVR
jgi:hypothetical protein